MKISIKERENACAETAEIPGRSSGSMDCGYAGDASGKWQRALASENTEGEKMVDHLADALNTMKTHEMVGQNRCSVKATRLVKEVLGLLKMHRYLKDFQFVEDGRGGTFDVALDGRINNCGVVKPRTAVRRTQWAKWEQQFIPGVGVGLLIVSTPKGVMTNSDADSKGLGGRLLAYIY